MPHPIFPCNSDRSGSSDGFRSCEGDAIQTNNHDVDAATLGTSAGELPISGGFTASTMSIAVLTEHCLSEINYYCDGELHSDIYCVELLHRTTLPGNQDARKVVQQCLRKIVHGWMDHHPEREVAYQLDSEENYVAEAFTRFYQTTAERQIELDRLSVALQYLQVCLNSAILDKLRASSRLRIIPSQEPRNTEGSAAADPESSEVWEMLRKMLPSAREQRLAYLLFHCTLKPREVIHLFPQEFHDVQEIFRVRRTIIERLLDHMDQCERR